MDQIEAQAIAEVNRIAPAGPISSLGGPSSNPFLDFRFRYESHSELFVRECFGFPNEEETADGKDIYPWQAEVLAQYDLRTKRIGIRSGHGVGKTTLLAWIMWHHILCRYPQKTAVTAPSEKQLFDALWAEFEAWGNRLPRPLRDLVELKADSAELRSRPAESFISIKTARVESPEALQGVHSTWVLLLVDEGSGVPDAVWEAAGSSMTGPHPMAILTGNPVRGQGFFFDVFKPEMRDLWWTRHVPCSEVPLATAEYAQLMERTYGANSNVYRVRVLGEFPIAEDDVIIPYDLVEPAFTREVEVHRTAPVIWGLDCARFGSNKSALAKRQTQQLLEPVRWWAKLDAMDLAARVKLEWDETPDFVRPVEICVDALGMGGPVADRLRQLGLPARDVNVSETPALVNADRYADLRTELWFKARDWFARRTCKLPTSYSRKQDADFIGELTHETYAFQRKSGKIYVTPKDQLHSPDLADAFVLTFASDAMTLVHGDSGYRWKPSPQKVNRGLI